MTHTHTSRPSAMGTVALAASAASLRVEGYESERSQLRRRWLLIAGALIVIAVNLILVIVFSGGGGLLGVGLM